MGATKSSTDVLLAAFPGRVSLSPKEVARAIHGEGKDTKKRVEAVRQSLDAGTLIPGLRKRGPRWQVPIAALGAALDAQVRVQGTPGARTDPAPRRSKHSTIGPRMLLAQQRSHDAWLAIAAELEAEAARLLGQRLEATLDPANAPARPRRFHTGDQ